MSFNKPRSAKPASPKFRLQLPRLPPVPYPIPPSLRDLNSPHLSPTSAFRNYHALSELHDPRNTTHDELGLRDTVVLGPQNASAPSPTLAQLEAPARPRSKSQSHAYGQSWERRGPFTPAVGVVEEDIEEYFGSSIAGKTGEGVSGDGVKSPSTASASSESSGSSGTEESSGGSATGV